MPVSDGVWGAGSTMMRLKTVVINPHYCAQHDDAVVHSRPWQSGGGVQLLNTLQRKKPLKP